MEYDRNAVRAIIDAAREAATGPVAEPVAETVPIFSAEMIRDLVKVSTPQRPALFMVLPKYAPKDTEGWIYTVAKINRTTVDLQPLGGGRVLRGYPDLLVVPTPEEIVAYDTLRGEAAASGGVHSGDVHIGSVVRLCGPRLPHPETMLWTVTAFKGVTEIKVAPLCGDGTLLYGQIPLSYVVGVIAPQELAAALRDDARFAA